jgi:ADP-L-glycero-D-manno-heptose 6-epimerase
MEKDKIIIITGAAGFIGSYMTGYLNRKGYENLILVDQFDEDDKELNLHGKKWLARVERDNLIEWLSTEKPMVSFVFHLGARTDTTEFDYSIHEKLNLEYSKDVWNYCTYNTIPLIYASSAATYGAGEWGYKDDHAIVEKLQPLNPYGISKNEFDKWAVNKRQQSGVRTLESPPFWAGL